MFFTSDLINLVEGILRFVYTYPLFDRKFKIAGTLFEEFFKMLKTAFPRVRNNTQKQTKNGKSYD